MTQQHVMPRWFRWAGVVAFVLIVIALVVVPSGGRLYAEPAGAVTMRIEPAALAVPVSGAFTVQVKADLNGQMNVNGLGAAEADVSFDPSYLEGISGSDGGGLESTGRTKALLPSGGVSPDNTNGNTAIGSYSYDSTNPSTPGPTGDNIHLWDVTFKAKQIGLTSLSLANALMTDTQANPWPDGAGNSLSVSGASVFTVPKAFLCPSDFDLDGKDDIGFYRPAQGLWGMLKSSTGFSFDSPDWRSWGIAGDLALTGDVDGDGRSDFIVYRPPSGGQSAAFVILKSSTNYDFGQAQVVPAGWSSTNDIPVCGDFDGDGATDLGVWRGQGGIWILAKSSANFQGYIFAQWGDPGDVPVAGDFDGDGKDDIGFYRPDQGLWGVLKSSAGFSFNDPMWFSWGGQQGDFPIIGDFDADGKVDPAVRRPPQSGQSAAFVILKSSTNYDFGQPLVVPAGWDSLGDTAVLGDFDGDQATDLGVWRRDQGVWVIAKSSANFQGYIFAQWGASTDYPVP